MLTLPGHLLEEACLLESVLNPSAGAVRSCSRPFDGSAGAPGRHGPYTLGDARDDRCGSRRPPDVAGGLSNVASVIAQIGDLDVPALALLASVGSRSVARRLGRCSIATHFDKLAEVLTFREHRASTVLTCLRRPAIHRRRPKHLGIVPSMRPVSVGRHACFWVIADTWMWPGRRPHRSGQRAYNSTPWAARLLSCSECVPASRRRS
jgi:hypothetical protein